MSTQTQAILTGGTAFIEPPMATPSSFVVTAIQPSSYIEPTQQPTAYFTVPDPLVVPSAPAPVYTEPSSANKVNVGAIAGGVVGGVVAIAVVVGVLFWMRRRRQVKSRALNTVPPPPVYSTSRSSLVDSHAPVQVYDHEILDEKDAKDGKTKIHYEKRVDGWPADKKA